MVQQRFAKPPSMKNSACRFESCTLRQFVVERFDRGSLLRVGVRPLNFRQRIPHPKPQARRGSSGLFGLALFFLDPSPPFQYVGEGSAQG
jgi:hypothetical protein